MKVDVKIQNIKTVNELPGYWSNDDFIQLLDKMNLPDADQIKPEELKELLYMATTDFEPSEAAEIILTYKLGDTLTAGQIQTIAHDMTGEKVAETYADPSFHYDLFNINQLLFKAFKGKFPNTEASVIVMEMTSNENIEVNKEVLTKALAQSLSERSIIQRLYEDQVTGKADFGDAEKIIWLYHTKGENTYEIITSRYWIEKADIENGEYEAEIKYFEE
jgi:GTPase SAR1 family protein